MSAPKDGGPPGRDLDALVAEKVMGGKPINMTETMCPPYSTSIEAAWRVVERFEGRYTISGPQASIAAEYQNTSMDKWEAELLPPGESNHYNPVMVSGETAPHAICLAALKAVGE